MRKCPYGTPYGTCLLHTIVKPDQAEPLKRKFLQNKRHQKKRKVQHLDKYSLWCICAHEKKRHLQNSIWNRWLEAAMMYEPENYQWKALNTGHATEIFILHFQDLFTGSSVMPCLSHSRTCHATPRHPTPHHTMPHHIFIRSHRNLETEHCSLYHPP